MKLLSIITINYNDATGLNKTIESVRKIKKGHEDIVEFIVIDGASSDNSLNVISNNLHLVDEFVSESDNGIYDAMNKGVKISSGSHVCFMNSGDVFYSDFDVLKYTNGIGLGEVGYFNNVVKLGNIYYKRNLKENDMPCHQAMIIPRKCFDNKKFRTDYKVASDYEFNKWLLNNFPSKHIDRFMCINELGGASNNWGSFSDLRKHMSEIIEIDGLSIPYSLRLYFVNIVKYLLIKAFGFKLVYGYIMWKSDENN